MILISQKKISAIAKIAQELASQQTVEELANLAQLTGQMYDTGHLAAEVAVKLILRVLGMHVESRSISPVDYLVDQAAATYRKTYVG